VTKYYVYALRSRDHYKIGVTKDLPGRIKTIKSSNPHGVELVIKKGFSPKEKRLAYKFEKHLHRVFKDKRANGEWFKLDESALGKAKEIFKGDPPKPSGEADVVLVACIFTGDREPRAGEVSAKDIEQVDEYGRVNGWSRSQAAAELINVNGEWFKLDESALGKAEERRSQERKEGRHRPGAEEGTDTRQAATSQRDDEPQRV